MRIGLYGMPTSGKTHILNQIDFMEVIVGSKLLRLYDPDFDTRDEIGRERDRKAVAELMLLKDDFIMDGHYAFGNEIAFTEEEGKMYDIYVYLYISPDKLIHRMEQSIKNQKYLKFDIKKWQECEIDGLREYCHKNNKDFYVIDCPPENEFVDTELAVRFIHDLRNGFSCLRFAKDCTEEILKESREAEITLLDGDKTLTIEDSSSVVFGYKTQIYDGNFYTGYQSWLQAIEFQKYTIPQIESMPVTINNFVMSKLGRDAYILTSGNYKVWNYISSSLMLPFYCGTEMSAETKYFITKFLQNAGKKVCAFGDGMNDYYMLKQADRGYLIPKKDGTISRSLKGKDLEGINICMN